MASHPSDWTGESANHPKTPPVVDTVSTSSTLAAYLDAIVSVSTGGADEIKHTPFLVSISHLPTQRHRPTARIPPSSPRRAQSTMRGTPVCALPPVCTLPPSTILPIVTLRPALPSATSLRPRSSLTSPRRKTAHVATAAALTRQHHIHKFFAGGFAGALSAFFTAPLEVLRTRMQASAAGRARCTLFDIIRLTAREGVPGFYRGLGVSLVGTLPARSIYFATYARTKRALANVFGADHPISHVCAAVAAGSTSNFVMSPLWVIRTRMQLDPRAYTGYIHACANILRTEGLPGLYRGYSASLWGTSEAAIHFVLYERLKKLQGSRLSPLQYTVTAAASKLVASIATYPHERVRVLMREVPAAGAAPKYRAMVQSLRLIAKEEGWRGLYRGMGVHLARTVPNTAIMFLSYELISKGLERRHRQKMKEIAQEGEDGNDVT